ncbi:MAG: hypothetical protein DHS20C08_08360 [Rhodomicrobium sp.]|nr:MAG: hypothetical protein DHS20C08_08360 [Rhodomicrobium sp.]
MTDINTKSTDSPTENDEETTSPVSLSGKHEHILTLMELFYFAYRDFTGDGDEVLAKIGYGRAHHRVIHFVHHYPGLRVAELLSILKITKQSLARVLKQLVDEDYITQKPGQQDRRERLLYTTQKGQELATQLAKPQINRFEHSINQLSKKEQETVEKFLFSLIQQGNRHDVINLMAQNGHEPYSDISKKHSSKSALKKK